MISVAKAEWGAKHTCLSCGAKFYEMGRNPITCPACDAPFTVEAPGRARRSRKAEVVVVEPVVAAATKDAAAPSADDPAALVDDVDDLIDDDDEDDAVVALTDDDEDDGDDVLAEADINKNAISDE